MARFDVVDTQVLCTNHAVSKSPLCRLMSLIVGTFPQDHLELWW